MLPGVPAYWNTELIAAEGWRTNFVQDLREMLGRYTGPGYRSDMTEASNFFDPENHAFEWVSLMVPMMVFGLSLIHI